MVCRLLMLCKMGTMVEYGVFGQETTVDWTIISDAKGTHAVEPSNDRHDGNKHYILCFEVVSQSKIEMYRQLMGKAMCPLEGGCPL